MRLSTAVVVAAVLIAAAAPADAKRQGASLDLSLPLSLLSGLDGTLSLTCGDADEKDTGEMIRALQRKGSRGTWESRDDDSRLNASRQGQKFRLRAWEDGTKRFDLKMPWSVAECLFGGRRGETFDVAVESLRSHGGLHLRLTGERADVGISLD